MLRVLPVLVALLFVSCATRTPQTNRLVKNRNALPERTEIKNVPFIKQDAYQCGPSTMAMTLKFWGKKTSVEELMPMMFTKGMSGTFQSEMLSTPRLSGLQALPITNLNSLLLELSSGHPVIVFQNLGLSFAPKWHYSVATGYNLKGPDIIMHTGLSESSKVDMRLFERNWKLADYWALLILPPDRLSASLSESDHAKAGAALEELGRLNEAETVYKTVLKKWPESYLSLIGLGNVNYAKKDYLISISYLKKASELYPDSPEVWHNLATAQGAAGKKADAKESSQKAIKVAGNDEKDIFRRSLKEWIH